MRERIRYLHYSLKTEKAYLYWVRFFVLWCAKQGGMRAPKEMGSAEVEAFLTMLANERQVSPSTHRQALNAILFLYRDVLCLDLPWLAQIGRPPEPKRIPVVLTVAEVQMVLGLMRGAEGLMARWMLCSAFDQFVSPSQPDRNPTLPHPLFRLLHGVFAVVKDARGQHSISAALLHTVGQVV